MVKLRIEKSKSRTAKHAVRDIALIVDADAKTISEPKPRRTLSTETTYSRGEASEVVVDITPHQYAVQIHMVRNLRGHVKGEITIYDYKGRILLKAVYRRLKLRYSCGDPEYSWIVELVAEYLKLPIKRINLKPLSTKECAR